jgi:hypothetical protein
LFRTLAAPGYSTLDWACAVTDNVDIGVVEMHVGQVDVSDFNIDRLLCRP